MPIVANAASTNIRNKAISKPTNARSIPGRSLFTSADTTPNVMRKTETLHLQRSNHSTSLSNNGVESATKRRRIDAIILCQGPSGNIAIRERILIACCKHEKGDCNGDSWTGGDQGLSTWCFESCSCNIATVIASELIIGFQCSQNAADRMRQRDRRKSVSFLDEEEEKEKKIVFHSFSCRLLSSNPNKSKEIQSECDYSIRLFRCI